MIAYHDVAGKGKKEISFAEVPLDRASEYACEDAEVTLRLMKVLDGQLEKDGNQDLFRDLEMRLLPVLVEMEMAGVLVDTDVFARMSKRFAGQLEKIQGEIYEEAGTRFNINSPKQLGFILFEKLGLPTQGKTSKTRAYATDVRALEKLAAMEFRIPDLLLRYREPLQAQVHLPGRPDQDGRSGDGPAYIPPSIRPSPPRAALSSSNPNLQNIPVRTPEGRAIRKGFVAGPGNVLLSADYSQVELRVFRPFFGRSGPSGRRFGGTRMCTPGRPVSSLSRRTGKPRRRCAGLRRPSISGSFTAWAPHKLSTELGIDFKTAKSYIDRYYEKHEGVERFRETMIEAGQGGTDM